jgi:hypothetical protein
LSVRRDFLETMGNRIQGEDVKTFFLGALEFGDARIICGNKGVGVEIRVGMMVW